MNNEKTFANNGCVYKQHANYNFRKCNCVRVTETENVISKEICLPTKTADLDSFIKQIVNLLAKMMPVCIIFRNSIVILLFLFFILAILLHLGTTFTRLQKLTKPQKFKRLNEFLNYKKHQN